MLALIGLMIFGILLCGVVGALGSILWMLKQLYIAFEAVTFGIVRGVALFLRGAFVTLRWLFRNVRVLRRAARVGGLYAAQVTHARYFVWSYFVSGWYFRNELRQRQDLGKSGTPSTHDK